MSTHSTGLSFLKELPSVQSVMAEWGCLSYDSKVHGNKILGSALQSTCPEMYTYAKSWTQLSGQDRTELFLVQKKALAVLAALKEDPQVMVQFPERLHNQLRTVEFLGKMSLEYGQNLTHAAYLRIKDEIRSQLDSGEAALNEEQEARFKQKLAEAQQNKVQQQFEFELPMLPALDKLPSAEERIPYWQSLSPVITRSREGHIGVFYVHNPEFSKDLVVKAPLRPAQECFAARLFQEIGFLVPDTQVVDRKSPEGQLIERALKKSPEYQAHCKSVPFSRYLVMNRVYGCAIEEIDQPIAKAAFTNDRISLVSLLKQMGTVAAVDVLMHYQDRLPHIGYSNWGNLMCIEHEKRLAFAIAIDQSVDLSKPTAFEIDKMGRVEEITQDVLTHPEQVSEAAKAIWEQMPEPIKEMISPEEGESAIQEGLVSGFQTIASRLSPDTLNRFDGELRALYTKTDFVKVDDLIRAYQIIASKCSVRD